MEGMKAEVTVKRERTSGRSKERTEACGRCTQLTQDLSCVPVLSHNHCRQSFGDSEQCQGDILYVSQYIHVCVNVNWREGGGWWDKKLGGEARKENSTCKKKEEYLQDTYTFSIRY